MKIALVQHDIAWEDRAATLGRLGPQVAEAAATGARLVVLTEMFAVGFSMATDKVAESSDGETTTWMEDQAAQHGCWIAGSVPTRGGGAVRNRFVLASPEREVRTYDKVRLFTPGDEAVHYRAGDGPATWDVEGVRITPFVCYDLRFADLWWDRGPETDLFVCVASWPAVRRHHWRSLLVARAIENQCFVAGCNRVGAGGDGDHSGDSLIIDPGGVILADAGDAETIITADIDPKVVTQVRADLPFLADR